MSTLSQPAILTEPPAVGRSLTFRIAPETDVAAALKRLRDGLPIGIGVIGIGEPVARALGRTVPGLRTFPAFSGPACSVPSTQQALWFLLRGADRGVVFDVTQQIREIVADAFIAEDAMDTFMYQGGRDLTRFEDGTENPKGSAAIEAAIVAEGAHLAGSSFVAVQRWVHDLVRFRSFPAERREMVIGRQADSNDEIEDAPPEAHVKRSAQESYEPPAFMLRRSMPWATADREGLEFIAFGESLDRFERVMRRMTGLDDGIVDGLFTFSRPITGGYYWCPPIDGDRLDLTLLGV